ncbi:sphingomyelin phosphodiesterase 4, neutral membrane (neutral sphingomyelinase-3) [Chamberlinius hualienensis]
MAANVFNEYSVAYRFQCALALPISRRCDDIILLMNECGFKDAHSLFPLLVESIFGFGSHPGWGIGSLYRRLQPKDFDTLRYFLCPSGPLIRFIYKLNSDAYLKYEFPTQCLPIPLQKSLESGIIPLGYHNKLQAQGPGKLSGFLSLNPFEFFIYHMAYFLIGSHSQKNELENRDHGECLYVCVVDDYLQYFLPCDGNVASMVSMQTSSPTSNPKLDKSFSPFDQNIKQSAFRLFKQIPITRQQSTPSVLTKEVSQPELWRNELVAQAFIDFWINHFISDSQQNAMTSPEKIRFGRIGATVETISPYRFAFETSFFPTNSHVRLARMLIKHIHYFVNNALPVGIGSFDDFKKSIIPQMLQKKMYTFIKHLFDHWPLDASFKLVLELWLSYIQPWRYVNSRPVSLSTEEKDRVVLSHWQPFVEENVMFYSIFFQKMIQRLLRVDLTSFKNASMLQRLCKVFSQPNLCQLIRVAESLLIESMFRILPTSNVSNRSLLARAACEAGHAAAIKQHIIELEGPNYNYIPMFGERASLQIKHIIMKITKGRDAMNFIKSKSTRKEKGWFGKLFSISLDYTPVVTKSEEEKTANYLDYGSTQLSYIFQIQMEDLPSIERFDCSDSFADTRQFQESSMDISDADLSVNRCIEILNKTRKPVMEFTGDPDLQIIRSYEIAPLVRILHQLSTVINQQFSADIQHVYGRSDFVGRLFRQIIQPPCLNVYSKDDHRSTNRSDFMQVIPPRICLRPFGAKQNVGYVLGLYTVAYVFGWNLITATIFFLFCAFIYLACMAWTETQPSRVTQ